MESYFVYNVRIIYIYSYFTKIFNVFSDIFAQLKYVADKYFHLVIIYNKNDSH